MKKITFLIYLSLIFSGISLDIYNQDNYKNNQNLSYFNKRNLNQSLKATLYSSIVPGSGQYLINNKKTKGLIFFGLEIIAIAGHKYYLDKAENYKSEYQNYGDQHWSFVSWCNNYYNWENPNNEFFNVFANDESGNYPDIWEDSHHIYFTYDDNGIIRSLSSSSLAFEELYCDPSEAGCSAGYNLKDLESAEDFYTNNNVIIRRDHNFYENISKYNHFFAGWDDNEGIFIYDNNGYIVATSANKSVYRSVYDKSVRNYRNKNDFISFLFVNHFISMLDALIDSKISSNRTAMMINYNPRIDFYQAQLSVKLD